MQEMQETQVQALGQEDTPETQVLGGVQRLRLTLEDSNILTLPYILCACSVLSDSL